MAANDVSDDRQPPHSAPGRYVQLLVRHPCKLITCVALFCLILIVIGVVVPPVPDFSRAQTGFEPRGTPYALQLNSVRQLNVYPAHRRCGNCVEGREVQQPPAEACLAWDLLSAAAQRTSCSPQLLQRVDEQRSPDPCSSPYPQYPQSTPSTWSEIRSKVLGQIEVCYGEATSPSPNLYCGPMKGDHPVIVTVSGSGGSNIGSLDHLRQVCDLSRKLRESEAYSDLGRKLPSHMGGTICPLYSLPESVMLLDALIANGSMDSQMLAVAAATIPCNTLDQAMLDRVLPRLETCGQRLWNGTCKRRGGSNCHEKLCNANCQAECTSDVNLLVNWIYNYLTDKSWRNPQKGVGYTHKLRATNIVLPVQERDDHSDFFEPLMEESPDWFGDSGALKLAGIKIDNKFRLFNKKLLSDALLVIACVCLSCAMMIFHSRSFTITFVSALQIVGSVGVSYFVFNVLLNFKFFSFLNMNMMFVAVAIGVDDIFVFVDAYSQSYEFLALDTPYADRISWIVSRSFSAMLVTTITTCVAFIANVVSSITVIRLFGIFAACVIAIDFLLMMTILPAITIIVETTFMKNLCTLGGLNKAVAVSARETGHKKPFLARMFEQYIAPFVVHKYLKYVFFLFFSGIGIYCVVQAAGLETSTAEELQLFVSSNPMEGYDQTWRGEFNFENEKRSASGLPVFFYAGIKPSDTGDSLNPYDLGPLEFDSGSLTTKAAQAYFADLCDAFSSGPFYVNKAGEGCIFAAMRTVLQEPCGNRTSCCGLTWPVEETIFDQCLPQLLGAFSEGCSLGQIALDRWNHCGMSGFMLDSSTFKLKVVRIGYRTSEAYTGNVTVLQKFYDEVASWAEGKLVNSPSGVPKPFWYSYLGWWDLKTALNNGAYSSMGVAILCCAIVLLAVVGNVVVASQAIASIIFVLGCVVATLRLFGWQMDLMVAVILAICVGLCVDFVCHMSHAYVRAGHDSQLGFSWVAQLPCQHVEERVRRATYAMSTMGITVTMGAATTFGGGLCMLPASVKFFFQFGTFLVVTMFWALLFAIFHFIPMVAIVGPVGQFGDLWNIYDKVFICCRQDEGKPCRKVTAESQVAVEQE